MENIYSSGKYLENTKTWHSEDSQWKAEQITTFLSKNLPSELSSICEVGCGSGAIIENLALRPDFKNTKFFGYDISPQAIDIAENQVGRKAEYKLLPVEKIPNEYDLLMAIDVFEHVPDYLGFLEECKNKANYKLYHIPLDIHLSSVLRSEFVKSRAEIGHIHYFSAESAIATLEDTGHSIIASTYTPVGTGLFLQHPTLKRAIANIPRVLVSLFSTKLAARIFGGYSLLVLTK